MALKVVSPLFLSTFVTVAESQCADTCLGYFTNAVGESLRTDKSKEVNNIKAAYYFNGEGFRETHAGHDWGAYCRPTEGGGEIIA